MVTKSKVRSIHSSLAIETNSLSLFGVESISQYKQIIGKKMKLKELALIKMDTGKYYNLYLMSFLKK